MDHDLIPTFDRLVGALEQLVQDHLLFFRVQAGRVVATELYGGDVATMREQLRRRDGLLAAFVQAHPERLDNVGLSEELLRQSLHAWAVVQLLDDEIVRGLRYTHVLELARVDDDPTRAMLARATVENGWSRAALKAAIQEVRAGQWPDRQPDVPGLQPTPAAEEAPEVVERPALAPGRVVTRFEKTADDLDELADHWEGVDPAALAPAQRRRAQVALRRLRERVVALEKRFG